MLKKIIVAMSILVFALMLISCGQGKQVQQPYSTPASSTSTAIPDGLLALGKPQQVDMDWLVTINTSSVLKGEKRQGYTYLDIDFTLKNTSLEMQNISGFDQFTLSNQFGLYEGTRHDFKASMAPGALIHHSLIYEVPLAVHTYVLWFEPPRYRVGGNLYEWTVKI